MGHKRLQHRPALLPWKGSEILLANREAIEGLERGAGVRAKVTPLACLGTERLSGPVP